MLVMRRDAVRATPELSVIIPAFNQAGEIAAMIRATDDVLQHAGVRAEIIVVSDGSNDGTAPIAAGTECATPLAVLEYTPNEGKGHALTRGSREAAGDWIAWIDADLDLHPRHLPRFLEACRDNQLDALVGSKRHPGSLVDYPRKRRVYSALYQWLIRTLFRFNVRDTQVGLKVFRSDVLHAVLPRVLVKRYAFDVEVLAIARRLGYTRIAEYPIALTYQFSGSGMNPTAVAQALRDTAAIFYRMYLLRWYDQPSGKRAP